MSAIAGFANPGRGGNEAVAERMAAALAHRGPDGRSVWCGEDAGLVHLASFVTPEDSHERWPQASGVEVRLVADVRLDNRDSLAGALDLPRHPRGFHTDGELLLAAYRKWGEESPIHLEGDFAFAVWDGAARTLFLARDAMGGKPLFYHAAAGGELYFATEMKALFAATAISRQPDAAAVAYHFAVPVSADGEATFYAAVKALAPGQTLTLSAGGVPRLRRYWALDPERELRLGSDGEYAEAFRDQVERAVAARLRTVGRVGITLSGGLDSSTLASVAAKLLPGRVNSFSAIFPDVPAADERRYQQSVVTHWSLPHQEYAADAHSPLRDHADIVRHIDGWQTAGNLRLNWNLYRLAAGSGVNVVLEGFDGDTVVSHGIGYFGELAQQRRWLRLAVEAGAHARSIGLPVLVVELWHLSMASVARIAGLLAAHGAGLPPKPCPPSRGPAAVADVPAAGFRRARHRNAGPCHAAYGAGPSLSCAHEIAQFPHHRDPERVRCSPRPGHPLPLLRSAARGVLCFPAAGTEDQARRIAAHPAQGHEGHRPGPGAGPPGQDQHRAGDRPRVAKVRVGTDRPAPGGGPPRCGCRLPGTRGMPGGVHPVPAGQRLAR
jgi:asparagine synthase (glutamine-hydrolysing)